MLANVLIRSEGNGRATVAATDLRVALRVDLACSLGDSIGIVIDAKKLHELVNNASADEISIQVESNGWATIKSGKVTFKIAGQPDANFPTVPSPTGAVATVENAMLREMIARTIFASSDDESRPAMAGVHMRSDGNRLTMTSTDGYRVCRLSRSMSIPPISVIAPCLETVRAVIQSAPTCQLGITREHLFITQDSTSISIKLIDLTPPMTDPIFEMSRPISMTASREALLIAMKRSGVMTTESTCAKLSLSLGSMRVSVINPDLGEVHEDLEVDFRGAPIAIGFNPNFLVDALSQMSSDRVIMEISGPLDPALLRQVGSDDYSSIVLPMRVQ